MKPTFATDRAGRDITRQRRCECGAEFTQSLLSPQWLEMVEKYSKGAIRAISKQIPDYFVPVHCPPCERKDIAMQARRDEFARDPAPPYGEAAD